ncbi:MAG: hypothetical protein GF416_05200 [Candidatus Altiarchaeales archaeon]|nr:hypothetical protein [Candidatus Altiarchaeales archaeon]MBD3416513.1 hypothetical protein [Candidatus Altiarchaeales archaeon]
MNRLNEVLDAISKEDSVKLRELAGHYSDKAAVTQEEEIVKLSMITYCFHKIFIKMHFREKTEALVESALKKLSAGDLEGILSDVDDFDSDHGLFEGGLVWKARIKMASRMHSRGISLTQSASLTGAHVSDILEYVGETKGYEHAEGKTVPDRLNIARDIFG